jgi:hypothetical protein
VFSLGLKHTGPCFISLGLAEAMLIFKKRNISAQSLQIAFFKTLRRSQQVLNPSGVTSTEGAKEMLIFFFIENQYLQ